jgi:acetyl-CoA carboxylase biotin carboxyl carrier protein
MEERSETIINSDDLFRILKLMEESDWDEIELTTKNFKFVAGKRLPRDYTSSVASSFTPLNDTKSDNVKEVGSGYQTKAKVSDIPKNKTEVSGPAIYAPMMGTFYRAPGPGDPPFVEVGDSVTEHSIVGMIEVMKVMSSIEAGVAGRISTILVENGKLVEYKQPLFLVEPEDQRSEPRHE